jgi:hypothetical protein
MHDDVREIAGTRVLACEPDGAKMRRLQDASDLIAAARSDSASMVVLPMDRLDPAFFQLRTGFAGEFLQKFVNYRVRLAILGDFSQYTSHSTALRDLIRESNRGNSVWFLADIAELEYRLTA